MRGRYQVHAGRDAVGAVLFDHAAEDGRRGQGTETFAWMVLLVMRTHLVERGRRRPAEPLVRGGGRGHRGRLVADRWRHVRQHDDAVRGHSPLSVGRRCDRRRRRMAKSLQQTKMENYRNGTTINVNNNNNNFLYLIYVSHLQRFLNFFCVMYHLKRYDIESRILRIRKVFVFDYYTRYNDRKYVLWLV